MITVNIDGRAVSGSVEDLRQLLGINGAAPDQKRGPGRPAKSIVTRASSPSPAAANESKPVSAARKKSRKLQGQYMGFIRQLNAADKARVKEVLTSKGKEAAIAEAQKLLK